MFRRNPAVRLPLERLGRTTSTGVPYLRLEVVLLYKSNSPEEYGEDFHNAAPALSAEARAWLKAALDKVSPGHAWARGL